MSHEHEEQKREQRLKLLEDHIGRSLAESEKSGELRSARSFGKPLDLGDGYDETPLNCAWATRCSRTPASCRPKWS
jgi:hypothetical protein